ncbi:MAG: NAD(P)/FAD-dependent oxidoreductase [Gemmatimonadaceae bacterium]
MPLPVVSYDAVIVGSGPNGLAAAITLARAGRSVLVREAQSQLGGGASSRELTLPGFVHDPFSAIHPLGAASPFFRGLPLADHGLEWVAPPAALAHPLDDGRVALLETSIDVTGASFGSTDDAYAYHALMAPLVEHAWDLFEDILAPLRRPHRPWLFMRFGLSALRSSHGLVMSRFRSEPARALFAGISAHAAVPPTHVGSASFGLVLAMAAHVVGWPFPRGGSQSIGDALASYLRSLGGVIEVNAPVRSLQDLPRARAVLFDVTPRQLVAIAGERITGWSRWRLSRFRYGPGSFKMDWALSGPVPWTAPECTRAATLHLGGPLAELTSAEQAAWNGRHAARPYLLVAQQSLFDASRAPAGRHTFWAYCHVPNGSNVDMAPRIEAQIERFAPGFRDLVLARSVMGPSALEHRNANLVGGDVAGGANNLSQLLFRPLFQWNPYATAAPGVYLCSSSTPPGGGVHGMCGYHAAKAVLGKELK